jgi:hypothetical protein
VFGFTTKQLLIVLVAVVVAAKWAQGQTKAGKPLPLLG